MTEEYAERATQINQKFLCISDHGMMAAIPRQIRACEEHKIKPIFACELYYQPDHPGRDEFKAMDSYNKNKIRKSYHLLAIAKNEIGLKNLTKLSSWAWTEGFYYKPRVNQEQLLKHKEGLIVTSCCYNSEVGQAFDKGGAEAADEKIKWYKKHFGDNYYLEIMLLDFEKQKPYDKYIVGAADRFGLPIVLTNDCFVKGTPVTTSTGVKNIEDVAVGDLVLTHEGRWRCVEFCGSRSLNDGENVLRVKTELGSYCFDATSNHKLRVATKREAVWCFEWKQVKEIVKGDNLLLQKVNPNDVFANKDCEELDLGLIIDIKSLIIPKKGNQHCCLRYDEKSSEFISYQGWDCRREIKISRYLKVDDEFLAMIGWYIAEGWSEKNSNQVGFALHEDEEHVATWLIEYFSKFGIIAKKYKVSEHGIAVRFSSVVFNKVLGSMCGIGAGNKKMPSLCGKTFGIFSSRQIAIILSSVISSDGHRNTKQSGFHSTSKNLIYEIATFINGAGIVGLPVVDCRGSKGWNDSWSVVYGSGRKHLLEQWLSNGSIVSCDHLFGATDLGNVFAIPFLSAEPIEYSGLVYDFQVEEDHSFIAGLYQSSNCHYCLQEDSLYQSYMLMIAKNTTVADIEKKLQEDDKAEIFELQDKNLWMKSEEELNQKWLESYQNIIPYDVFCQAKANTVKVCQLASGVKIDRSIKLPQIPDADAKLFDLARQGMNRRGLLGDDKKHYVRRLREEYELITRKQFSSYFIIQKQLVDEARRISPQIMGYGDGSEAVGPGRGCLDGDVPVVTANGFVPLRDIKTGDLVLNKEGKYCEVSNTMKYDVEESLINLRCYYGDSRGVTMTADHKVWAEKVTKPPGYDKWANSTRKSRKQFLEPTGNLQWIAASEIEVGDWVFMPVPLTTVIDLPKIDLGKYSKERMYCLDDVVIQERHNPLTGQIASRKCCKRWIEQDEDFFYVLGVFAGDGWICTKRRGDVGFCFHSIDNVESMKRVVAWIEKMNLDYSVRYACGKRLVQLFVKSKFIESLFEELFYQYRSTSQTKHIPSVVFSANKKLKMSFIDGYIASDGYSGSEVNRISSRSKNMVDGIRILSWSVGMPASHSLCNRFDKRTNKHSIENVVRIPKFQDGIIVSKACTYSVKENGIMMRVSHKTKVEGVKQVYDITVPDGNNYVTSSFVVHNSAAGSLLCYVLGITNVDPIKHDLLFSRFLSENRGGKSIRTKFTKKPIRIGE